MWEIRLVPKKTLLPMMNSVKVGSSGDAAAAYRTFDDDFWDQF
jgi:hypothetical protein